MANTTARRRKPPRPFVTANFALTWDGRVTTRNYTPSDFSSRQDKRRLVEIRATTDAVLAGAGTIAADNMTMGIPADLSEARVAEGRAPYPLRVLMTNSGQVAPELKVFHKPLSPIHIFTTTRMPAETQEALRGKATLHLAASEQVDLAAMMTVLRREHDVRRLVCEGGPQVFRALLAADLIDELHVTFCPRIFGGEKTPTLTGIAGEFLPSSLSLALRQMEVVDGECFLRYRIQR
ncbi:MAG TPA: dihydrofolate reductase family protein [Chthoniobacteraceae bacterium]|jgi:riboflavin-specific deaminase-like protein